MGFFLVWWSLTHKTCEHRIESNRITKSNYLTGLYGSTVDGGRGGGGGCGGCGGGLVSQG